MIWWATSVRSAGVALFMCRVWRSGGVRSFSLDRVLCFCFESGVVVVSAAGWPATVDGWAVVGGQEQGGVKGWFRSHLLTVRSDRWSRSASALSWPEQ